MAHPAGIDVATFNLLVEAPVGTNLSAMQLEGTLAPISTAIESSATAPIPRFLNLLSGIPPLKVDFNLDGYADILWQDPASGLVQTWFLSGGIAPTIVGAANLTSSNSWRVVGAADFNADSRTDVVWQDATTGATQVWFLGGPHGNIVAGAALVSSGNSWRIRSVADFNADGKPDLVWQDQVSGFAQIWFMGGAQGTTVTGSANLTISNMWRVAGTADFNNDGSVDVLWQDPVTGAAQVWFMGGSTGASVLSAASLLSSSSTWRIASIVDVNADTKPDLVWQDPITGASEVWFLGGVQGSTVTGSAHLSGPNLGRIVAPR